jgi:hypothetical protein
MKTQYIIKILQYDEINNRPQHDILQNHLNARASQQQGTLLTVQFVALL